MSDPLMTPEQFNALLREYGDAVDSAAYFDHIDDERESDNSDAVAAQSLSELQSAYAVAYAHGQLARQSELQNVAGLMADSDQHQRAFNGLLATLAGNTTDRAALAAALRTLADELEGDK